MKKRLGIVGIVLASILIVVNFTIGIILASKPREWSSGVAITNTIQTIYSKSTEKGDIYTVTAYFNITNLLNTPIRQYKVYFNYFYADNNYEGGFFELSDDPYISTQVLQPHKTQMPMFRRELYSPFGGSILAVDISRIEVFRGFVQ